MARTATAPCFAIALVLAACISVEEGAGERPKSSSRESGDTSTLAAAAPVAWPGTFMEPAVLMAARVVVVGPEGLREHAAVMQDPDHHVYEEKTTAQGFVRLTKRREGIDYLAPIRGQLDALQIFAENELLVLERPGQVELSIEAEGDVYWRSTGTGEERRSEHLRLGGAK